MWDWPSYGHDAQHTFSARTTLTPTSVASLRPAWSFATGDAVTATPTVVDGTVYVGSWDGNFYAIDLGSGSLRWKRALDPQHGITPYPGQVPRDSTSDGGLVTSSAWYQRGAGGGPDVVIVGGGYTLYALDAHTGAVVWRHRFTGRPDLPPDPDADSTRIFSSPVVMGSHVIVGVDVDGESRHRGYIVAADLATGESAWTLETDIDVAGRVLNDGCGSVWSSGTVLPAAGLVVFGTADCGSANDAPYSELAVAIRAADGSIAWSFRPARRDTVCDKDFGASANAGLDSGGAAVFLGLGSKDGGYYSIDPASGRQRWSTNVVFGGFAGGFIGTTAYDGTRVYGSTALGDFGNFQGPQHQPVLCEPSDPRDTLMQEPSVHAFAAETGAVSWQASGAASFAPTTIAGGMTFNGVALGNAVLVRDAATGAQLARVGLPVGCWSGIATVGDALLLGTGSTYQGSPDAVVALTPGGAPPVVPAAG